MSLFKPTKKQGAPKCPRALGRTRRGYLDDQSERRCGNSTSVWSNLLCRQRFQKLIQKNFFWMNRRIVSYLNVLQRVNVVQSGSDGAFGLFQFVGRLQIDPILRCLSQNSSEPQGQFRSDWSRSVDHMGNTHGRNTGAVGKFRLRNAKFLQNFPQENTRVQKRQLLTSSDVRKVHIFQVFPSNCHFTPLMIIDDFHIPRMAIVEVKAYAPLLVDPDTPLAFSCSLQRFQRVRGRNSQIVDSRCRVYLFQSLPGALLNLMRNVSDERSEKECRRILVCERENHQSTINELFIFNKNPRSNPRSNGNPAQILPLDTSPLPGAFFGAGAQNTLIGGPRPERQADFFVPRLFLFSNFSAFSCRACDEYKTLRGNKSAVPMTVLSARRQFLASSHRLKIDHRSSR